MIVFVIIYALVAMTVAQAVPCRQPRLVQAICYAVLGMGWIIPLLPLIVWMERRDPA